MVKFTGTESSSFWLLAAEGRTFHTVWADHHNCPIGSYTLNNRHAGRRLHST